MSTTSTRVMWPTLKVTQIANFDTGTPAAVDKANTIDKIDEFDDVIEVDQVVELNGVEVPVDETNKINDVVRTCPQG